MKIVTKSAAIVIAWTINGHVYAEETELSLNKTPEGVQKSALQAVGGGKITKIVREIEKDGSVIYEVAYTVGEKKFETEISPEGKLLVTDEELTLSQAPDAVAKAIREKTAGGKVKKIEKCIKGDEVSFEAEFTKEGKKHEVKVAPDGKVIAEE